LQLPYRKCKCQDTNTDGHTITISIPEVALVDIEPAATKNITLGFTAPTEAGNPIIPSAANNTLWLNYSSIKSVADPSRNVSVKLNAVIPGVDVHVTAAAATGSGAGTLGTSAGLLTLSAADQTIISGIGSAYTGNGTNNGHNLTYALVAGSGPGGVPIMQIYWQQQLLQLLLPIQYQIIKFNSILYFKIRRNCVPVSSCFYIIND
jgi:hypothetical protein